MKNMLSYKAKQFMLIRKLKKSQQILEDGASSVQIGILNMWLSIICLKYDKITLNWFFLPNICSGALKFSIKSRSMKRF